MIAKYAVHLVIRSDYNFAIEFMMKEILQYFSKDIRQQDIEEFQSIGKLKVLNKQDFFIKENKTCTQLGFCVKGGFKYYLLNNGKEYIKDFVFENTFFTAFTSFILQKPSELYIQALEECEILIWDYETVNYWLKEKVGWQEFGRKIAEQLYIRKEKREIALLRDNAEVRYNQFLRDFPQISQKIPQHLISSYLGITPEHLSRIRAKR